MNNWKIYCPKFQYEKILDDWNTPWAGHKSFAYDLIRNLKPNRIVELGTYRGTSLFSMAQALKDESMKSKIAAIDTWEGDEHSGFYDNDIYEGVLCCILAPSSGHEHRYPVDCWRFFPDGFRALANFSGLEILESFHCWDREDIPIEENEWKDTVGIFRKNKQSFFQSFKFGVKNYIQKKLITL